MVFIQVGYHEEDVDGDWYVKVDIPKQEHWEDTKKNAEEVRDKMIRGFEHNCPPIYPKTLEYYNQLEKNYGQAFDEIETYKNKVKECEDRCDIILRVLKMKGLY